jgi:preprotein translocase subunit YajC
LEDDPMTNFLISDAQAQAAGAAPPGGGLGQIVILVIFVVVFYFLLIRPQQKRAKEHQAMLSKLSAGDEVVTAGGIVGKIREITDSFVSLEIAEGVCITVQRGQVTSLVPKGTYKGA